MKSAVYLIGSPCVGKSTIIKAWRGIGGLTVPEFLEPVPDFVRNAWEQDEQTRFMSQKWVMEQHVHKDELIKKMDYDGPILVDCCPSMGDKLGAIYP